jgi:hypothetical protein
MPQAVQVRLRHSDSVHGAHPRVGDRGGGLRLPVEGCRYRAIGRRLSHAERETLLLLARQCARSASRATAGSAIVRASSSFAPSPSMESEDRERVQTMAVESPEQLPRLIGFQDSFS